MVVEIVIEHAFSFVPRTLNARGKSKLINGVIKNIFMSNLFKSKFLLGLVVALALVVSTASTASAAITSTLKMGMSNIKLWNYNRT